jgi:hypothetical protein
MRKLGQCGKYIRSLAIPLSKSKLYYDLQSVGESILLSGTHLGPATNFSILSLVIFRQLRVCWCGAPSLTRGRVCNLQCDDASSVSSYIATDGLSVSSFWCRAPNGDHEQILMSLFDNYFLSSRLRKRTYTVWAEKCTVVNVKAGITYTIDALNG